MHIILQSLSYLNPGLPVPINSQVQSGWIHAKFVQNVLEKLSRSDNTLYLKFTSI